MNDYFFSRILLDLQNRIETEIPEIRYIDQQLGQLGEIGQTERPPLAYPAVLIDFPNASYSEMASNLQLGSVSIAFQLVFDTYSQTWHKAPEDVKKKGLEYLNIEQKLFTILQGWSLDYFQPLSRINVKSQNNNDVGLRVRELTFTTEYEDWSLNEDTYTDVEFSFLGSVDHD